MSEDIILEPESEKQEFRIVCPYCGKEEFIKIGDNKYWCKSLGCDAVWVELNVK